MDTIKTANKIIKEGIALLSDEAKEDFRAQANPSIFIDEAINNACGAVNEDEEKIAMLGAYAVQEANRVARTLWAEELLTPEIEKTYRTLPKLKTMADKYNEYTDARKARMDEIMELHRTVAEEEKELDIFKGIVNGIPADEAEKRYNEYRRQQQSAMGR